MENDENALIEISYDEKCADCGKQLEEKFAYNNIDNEYYCYICFGKICYFRNVIFIG